MQWPALVVVEDAADRGAIVQDHVTGRVVRGTSWIIPRGVRGRERSRRRCRGFLRGRVAPMAQGRLLDAPQTAYPLAHLHLGMTVGLQDGPGQITEEMVG